MKMIREGNEYGLPAKESNGVRIGGVPGIKDQGLIARIEIGGGDELDTLDPSHGDQDVLRISLHAVVPLETEAYGLPQLRVPEGIHVSSFETVRILEFA